MRFCFQIYTSKLSNNSQLTGNVHLSMYCIFSQPQKKGITVFHLLKLDYYFLG